jgi:ribokinase
VLFKGANYALRDPPPRSLFTVTPKITHLVLQNEIPLPDTLAHLTIAHANGIVTVFNPSPMPTEPDLLAFPWSSLHWLICNADEASTLLNALGESYPGAPSPPQVPTTDGGPPAIFAAYAVIASLRAHSRFSRSVGIVCTLGASGVVAMAPEIEEHIYVPAMKLPSGAKDTTGAGDCFTGYFVAGLMKLSDNGHNLDENSLELILRRSVCAAGMSCEHQGAMESIPLMHEIEERLPERVVHEDLH